MKCIMCNEGNTTVSGWSMFRESRGFKGQQVRHNITLTTFSSFGNIHRGEKNNMIGSWLPRDTGWCFMEALCWGSLNTFKISAGKSLVKTTGDWDDPSHFLWSPPGCKLANYDWPKKRVAAGHLWLSMASRGPAPSIKQGQNGTVYETEHDTYTIK